MQGEKIGLTTECQPIKIRIFEQVARAILLTLALAGSTLRDLFGFACTGEE